MASKKSKHLSEKQLQHFRHYHGVIKQWCETSKIRTNHIIHTIAAISIILLLYLLIWHPISTSMTTLKHNIQKQTSLYHWLRQKNVQIYYLRQLTKKPKQISDNQMANIITHSLTKYQLNKYLHNMAHHKAQYIQLQFIQVPFDLVIQWLIKLFYEYRIIIKKINITQSNTEGAVNLYVLLVRTS